MFIFWRIKEPCECTKYIALQDECVGLGVCFRLFNSGVPNLQATGGSSSNFQNSSPFDVDCEELPLQQQMELFDLPCSEDLKSKFLATHFYTLLKYWL